MAVPTSVSNWLSAGTCGSGAAVEPSTWDNTFCSSAWNAASLETVFTDGSEP